MGQQSFLFFLGLSLGYLAALSRSRSTRLSLQKQSLCLHAWELCDVTVIEKRPGAGETRSYGNVRCPRCGRAEWWHDAERRLHAQRKD